MLQSHTKRTSLRPIPKSAGSSVRRPYSSKGKGVGFQHKFSRNKRSGLSRFWYDYGTTIAIICLIFVAGFIVYWSISVKTEDTNSNDKITNISEENDKTNRNYANDAIGKLHEIKNKLNSQSQQLADNIQNNVPLAKQLPFKSVSQMNVIPKQNRYPSNSRIPSLTDPFGSFEVTYRLYKNINCDENDETSFITITKTLKRSDTSLANSESCPTCQSLCNKMKFPDETEVNPGSIGSIRIVSGEGELDLYEDCHVERYHATVYSFDECVHLYSWPPTRGIKVVSNTIEYVQPQPMPYNRNNNDAPPLQPHIIEEKGKDLTFDDDCPSYLIVYSCESSDYFGYQTQSNYYGFLTSGQHPKGEFMRLLTSSKIDDIASYVPTFTTKRHPYSRRYGPLNKADVIDKWYHSPHKPTQDVIVVIDPDNWIIRDVSKWVKRVTKGNALGEAAWFHGNKAVTNLWKEVCLNNCDWELDLVGVPYFVHKDDLEVIAPLFKKYILIMKDREEADPSFQKKYSHIQMGWGTEMFGYIFAAAHAGVKHEVVRGVQIRDVSGRPSNKKQEESYSMIHMGRAWFPKSYEFGRQWWHTEGRAWSHFGAQVWCKCNWTASSIIPWPLPDGTDFQSRHTLYLLHESRQYFGEIPKNDLRQPGEHSYHTPYP